EVNHSQHRRMQTVRLLGERRVHAINGKDILREVVGTDGKEIHFLREIAGHDGSRGDLDHDTDLYRCNLQLLPHLLGHCLRLAWLFKRGDHREHDLHRTGRRGAVNGPELRDEQFGLAQTKTNAANAEKWIVLFRQREIRHDFVAANVERTDNERQAVERAGHRAVSLELLVLGGRLSAFEEEKLRAHQPYSLGTRFDG